MRWLEILVIGIYAFQVSSSPFVVAIMLVARMLPMVLFGTVIGAAVEDMDRRQVLIWTCVLMTLTALTGAVAAAIDIMSLPLLAGSEWTRVVDRFSRTAYISRRRSRTKAARPCDVS